MVENQSPLLAKLAVEAQSILDKTPPQSPFTGLPRPLHPTPVVDWETRPLPPPPAYDDVAQDEDDMEVRYPPHFMLEMIIVLSLKPKEPLDLLSPPR